ncbi:MAG: hypothetical protein RIG62_27125 [Cyclobacteriaceae bacterium]
MGHESIVYGHICAIVNQPPKGDKLLELNYKIIQELPNTDDYPWITKWMFNTIPMGTQPIYRNQIIHFGASYKQVESEWSQWLDKFELILKKLYWFSATVHLETELVGDHKYEWVANIDHWNNEKIEPTTEWKFFGGPRDFEEQLRMK